MQLFKVTSSDLITQYREFKILTEIDVDEALKTNRLVSVYTSRNIKKLMNKYTRKINIVKNNDLETLENLLHDDFMFIRESGLVTRDEFIEHIKMLRTERGGLKFRLI